MNEPGQHRLDVAAAALGAGGLMLILGLLVWVMYHYTQPPPVDGARWVERQRNLSELNAQAKEQLDNYGWLDQGRGVVRLPVERAMELTAQEWRDPSAGRAKWLTLLARATPPPASTNATNAASSPNPIVSTNAPPK